MSKEKSNHKSRLVFLLFLLFVMIMGACSISDKENSKKEEGQESQKLDWQKKVKSTAASKKTKSEKADEVSLLASSYQPSEEELHAFEEDIIEEFSKDRYLSDINNHEYMLTNMFKCRVIDNFYDDQEQQPMDKFAYDFFQNTNYTYRGSMKVESGEIKRNEDKMNKSLSEMENE
ncbi:hypothetical protein [Neobacillus sp. D3-1R]|uniref:hypothetical protein n=1 Tax=Neobacillus sp. D3-1R TaxID=3445778 RepID=UPI003F9F431D